MTAVYAVLAVFFIISFVTIIVSPVFSQETYGAIDPEFIPRATNFEDVITTGKCGYCRREVEPGSPETACLGCGAPIRPIPKMPTFDDDDDYDMLVGDGKVIAVVSSRGIVPPPGPSNKIYR